MSLMLIRLFVIRVVHRCARILLCIPVLPGFVVADEIPAAATGALNSRLHAKHRDHVHAKEKSVYELLVVAVTLNQIKKGDYYIFRNTAGDYLIRKGDLKRFGLREVTGRILDIEGREYLAVNSVKDLEVYFDEKNLVLNITSKPELFMRNTIDLGAKRRSNVTRPDNNSAFLNYRLGYFGVEASDQTLNLTTEVGLRLYDSLLLSGFSQTRNSATANSVRLMSNWTYDWRDSLNRLTIGDFFAFSGDLGSTLNLGGISYSKRYATDPYFIQRPTIDLSGVVSTLSEADIYLDGLHLKNVKLAPGEFELRNINYYGGSRDVRVVIKDAFGREQLLNQDYYFSSAGLRQGLHEYSYNLGAVRKDYGQASNQYGKLATSVFHRYGVTDYLTLGLREESVGTTINAGPQILLKSNKLGAFSLALSASHDDVGGNGTASQFGYNYQRGNFSSRLLLRHFQERYAAVNDAALTQIQHQKVNLGIGASYGSRWAGYFGVDHAYSSQYDGSERRSTNITYHKALYNQLSFFGSVGHASSHAANSNFSENNLFVGLTYAPRADYNLRGSHQEKGGIETDSVQLTKNMPVGEGWGFRVRDENTRSDMMRNNTLDSYLQVNMQRGIFTAGYRAEEGHDSYQLSLAGAIGYVAGSAGMSRPIYDSFGLVRLDGLSNVSVLHNNQVVGRTDKNGEVFIPNMGSFLDNQISLNDRDIPIDFSLKSQEVYVSPGWRSGALVNFDIRRIRAVSGKLKLRFDGALKPLAYRGLTIARVGVTQVEPISIFTGKGGEFYIEDISPGGYTGSADTESGHCSFSITIPGSQASFIQLEETICEPNP